MCRNHLNRKELCNLSLLSHLLPSLYLVTSCWSMQYNPAMLWLLVSFISLALLIVQLCLYFFLFMSLFLVWCQNTCTKTRISEKNYFKFELLLFLTSFLYLSFCGPYSVGPYVIRFRCIFHKRLAIINIDWWLNDTTHEDMFLVNIYIFILWNTIFFCSFFTFCLRIRGLRGEGDGSVCKHSN